VVVMVVSLAVDAVGVTKSYGGVVVLDGVDVQVEAGSVFALLGPNGAGKTTTVRILATLVRPDAGRVMVAGFDVVGDRHRVRRCISLAGQYPTVDELLTGEENLRMVARLSGLAARGARQRAGELLEQFDLVGAGGRRVATYSGGMRRKLDLAASLVLPPSVLFLDEPTTGLDLRSRQTMWQVITGLAGAGVTVFLTTQYLEEADQMAERVAVIDNGVVVAVGSPADLKEQAAGHRLDITMVDGAAFRVALAWLGGRVRVADEERLTIGVATDASAAGVRGLLDDIDPDRTQVQSFALHSATLDDVFLALTGHRSTTARADAHA
jgi:ABC-2 type transport system ATP-binding protein